MRARLAAVAAGCEGIAARLRHADHTLSSGGINRRMCACQSALVFEVQEASEHVWGFVAEDTQCHERRSVVAWDGVAKAFLDHAANSMRRAAAIVAQKFASEVNSFARQRRSLWLGSRARLMPARCSTAEAEGFRNCMRRMFIVLFEEENTVLLQDSSHDPNSFSWRLNAPMSAGLQRPCLPAKS